MNKKHICELWIRSRRSTRVRIENRGIDNNRNQLVKILQIVLLPVCRATRENIVHVGFEMCGEEPIVLKSTTELDVLIGHTKMKVQESTSGQQRMWAFL